MTARFVMSLALVATFAAAARPISASAAGDVRVTLSAAGTLSIQGDAAGNRVAVGPFDPDMRVMGLDGTTMNGGTETVFPRSIRDIRISLGNGDDELVVNEATVARDLSKSTRCT